MNDTSGLSLFGNVTNECSTDLTKAELPVLLILSIILDGASVFVLNQIKSSNNPMHQFMITTLAVNDLVTTLLFTIMWIGGVTLCGKVGGDIGCSILGWFATSMVIWSAWVVVVMSAVRYLSVVRPFYYKLKVTVTTVRFGLLATIILTFSQLVFPFTGLVKPYKLYSENFVCAYDFAPGSGSQLHRVILGLISGFGLTTILTVLFFNGSIICALRRTQAIEPSTAVNNAREKRNSFANLQTKVVAGVYTFCYGPFLVRLMYDVIRDRPDQDGFYHSITMSLLFMSPLLNPFAYAAYNKNFRKYIVDRVRLILGKCGLTNTGRSNAVGPAPFHTTSSLDTG